MPSTSESPLSRKVISLRILVAVGFGLVCWASVVYGLELRRWTWDITQPIHFYGDVNNGYHWGSQAATPIGNPRGFLNVYDAVASRAERYDENTPDYRLDYAPLRLLLMTHWVQWTETADPATAAIAHRASPNGSANVYWDTPYAFFSPTLRFNDGTELFSAVGLFLLARHWARRDPRTRKLQGPVLAPFSGCFVGLFAALLFWFSPAVIISTHGWPTWDEWIIPFFVWAVWLACVDWWFCAGLVIGIGAMFKGQQFFVAPLFILWPLFLGHIQRPLRWLAGLLFAIGTIASPWLLSIGDGRSPRVVDWRAVEWLLSLAAVGIAVPLLLARRRRRIRAMIWPTRFPRLTAFFIGAALLACPLCFSGSLNWMYIGWGYGTRHYMGMTTGVSDNLAGILHMRYDWDIDSIVYRWNFFTFDSVNHSFPPHIYEIDMRTFLAGIYAVMFVICVIGIAFQYYRNDRRFLVAITATWLMFFTFMPQIHERYLLYAAGVGCALTAVSFGMTLLNLFLTILTWMMTLHVMLNAHHQREGFMGHFLSEDSLQTMKQFLDGTFPDAGWAVLLCAGIFLYLSLMPSKKPYPKKMERLGKEMDAPRNYTPEIELGAAGEGEQPAEMIRG